MDRGNIANFMRKFSVKASSQFNDNLIKRDIISSNIKPVSRPNQITLNLSTKCNYNCPICSINKTKKLFRNYKNNMITKKTIERMHEFFDFSRSVSFMGLLGEPLLNPDFFEIVKYFRKNTNVRLAVSTNGLLLSKANRDKFINSSFDSVTVSLHGATENAYKKLQAGDFNCIVENLRNLVNEKNLRKSIFPIITVVHALNWWNIYELPIFLDLMKEVSPDTIFIYHYQDYQGIEENISLKTSDIRKANHLIKSAYNYAKKIGVYEIITPKDPPLIVSPDKDSDLKFKNTKSCELPWKGLQLRGCITHADSYYVGCCNVLNIFRLNYQEFKESFRSVWHHPILMYLRETVNGENLNPFCKYCKSPERNHLKSVDNTKNNDRKDMVLDEFFKLFKSRFGDVSEYNLKGLTVLKEDPADIRLE